MIGITAFSDNLSILLLALVYVAMSGVIVFYSTTDNFPEWNYFLVTTIIGVIFLSAAFLLSVLGGEGVAQELQIDEESACMANLENICNHNPRGTVIEEDPNICSDVSLNNITDISGGLLLNVEGDIVCS